MAESSLSLGFPDFKIEVADFLGHGRTSGNWTADQLSEIDALVQGGLRQFYFPPETRPGEGPHQWSFLKPVTTLTTAGGDHAYDLPDDFGFIEGNFTFATDDGYEAIRIGSESQIRSLLQTGTVSGKPSLAAVRPKSSTGTTGQRFEVLFWPEPDAAYVLTYRYNALQSKLTDAAPYPLGGAAHGETIKASCVAMAELRKDDERGIHWQAFMERLIASVAYDKRQTPDFLGYNGDRSDAGSFAYWRSNQTTYNGQIGS